MWVDFRYLGERVRESSGLNDTAINRKHVRKQLNLIMAEIENGVFKFGERFPNSSKKAHFTEKEGRAFKAAPADVTFGKYFERWWTAMEPGMTDNQIRDYKTIVNYHLLPYFAELPFSEITPFKLKKYINHLRSKKNRYGKTLSGKRIRNILIPLRVIARDAFNEHGWNDLGDPFANLKLPKVRKFHVQPFSLEGWQRLIQHLPEFYRPYFEFAVQTGLRPSEQVGLKWEKIDSEFIYIESSRVLGREKSDLKTEDSRRVIKLRDSVRRVLKDQWKISNHFQSPYVFVNNFGDPINQDTLCDLFKRALKRASLPYRRMYETRHTFTSWALGAGETPEWVARTLGHVDTTMVYRTYGRYIPNFTRQDGSAFERMYSERANKKGNQDVDDCGHNDGHNR